MGKKKAGPPLDTRTVELLQLRQQLDPTLRETIQRRQEDRIAAAMRGDRPAKEYAEAQLRYALKKAKPGLEQFFGPGVSVQDAAVVTDPLYGTVQLVCRVIDRARRVVPPPAVETLL